MSDEPIGFHTHASMDLGFLVRCLEFPTILRGKVRITKLSAHIQLPPVNSGSRSVTVAIGVHQPGREMVMTSNAIEFQPTGRIPTNWIEVGKSERPIVHIDLKLLNRNCITDRVYIRLDGSIQADPTAYTVPTHSYIDHTEKFYLNDGHALNLTWFDSEERPDDVGDDEYVPFPTGHVESDTAVPQVICEHSPRNSFLRVL
jgi:hypothetical protein